MEYLYRIVVSYLCSLMFPVCWFFDVDVGPREKYVPKGLFIPMAPSIMRKRFLIFILYNGREAQ